MTEGITITGQGIVRTKEVVVGGVTFHEEVVQVKDFAWAHRVDEASDNLVYEGFAEAGTTDAQAAWAIRKILKSGTVTSTTWADGNINYDNIWNNREGLDYL